MACLHLRNKKGRFHAELTMKLTDYLLAESLDCFMSIATSPDSRLDCWWCCHVGRQSEARFDTSCASRRPQKGHEEERRREFRDVWSGEYESLNRKRKFASGFCGECPLYGVCCRHSFNFSNRQIDVSNTKTTQLEVQAKDLDPE